MVFSQRFSGFENFIQPTITNEGDKIDLKQATFFAFLGATFSAILFLVQTFQYFSIFSLGGLLSQSTLALFFFKLYSRQKGE